MSTLILLWALQDPPKLVPTKVTPAKDTTVVTEPLLPGGHVDYITAINRIRYKGVTNERNGARLLLSVWDGADASKLQKECFKRELDFEFGNGPHFVSLGDWLERQGKKRDSRVTDWFDDYLNPARVGFDVALPNETLIALHRGWLAENRDPLAVVAKAVRRPQWYAPTAPSRKRPQLIAESNLWCASLLLRASKAFAVRARMHLLDGAVLLALEDVDTLHLMATKFDENCSFNETLVAYRIANAAACLEALAADKPTTKEAALNRLQSLRRQPPLPTLDVSLDRLHRWLALNAAANALSYRDAVRWNGDELGWLADRLPRFSHDAAERLLSASTSVIDQNEVMRTINRHFDEVLDMHRNPDPSANETIEWRINELTGKWRNGKFNPEELRDAPNDIVKFLSRRYGRIITGRTFPDYMEKGICRRMTESHRRLAIGAWALATYRAENFHWPEKLDELDSIWPVDEQKDHYGKLGYRQDGDDALLYSIWENYQDDHGKREVKRLIRREGQKVVYPADDVKTTLRGVMQRSKTIP